MFTQSSTSSLVSTPEIFLHIDTQLDQDSLLNHVFMATISKAPTWHSQDRASLWFLNRSLSPEALKQAFQNVSDETKHLMGGSTITSIVMDDKGFTVIWMGDSPALLIGVNPKTGIAEDVKGLNEAHVPRIPQEEEYALGHGGQIDKDGRLSLTQGLEGTGNYSLSMSRAYGNAWLQQALNREVEIQLFTWDELNLNPALHWYALMGSDGILPESEYNLMFPRKDDQRIIDYVADKFLKDVLAGTPKKEGENWAESIAKKAQVVLADLATKEPEPKPVGYAAVDDTTLIIVPVAIPQSGATAVLTVADGHRDGGEVTAQAVIDGLNKHLLNI